MPQLPTVKIKHADGFCIINEADYDPKEHQLFNGEFKPDTPQTQSHVVGAVDDGQAIVPSGWQTLHWRKQVALAEDIVGGKLVAGEGQTLAEKAYAVINSASQK